MYRQNRFLVIVQAYKDRSCQNVSLAFTGVIIHTSQVKENSFDMSGQIQDINGAEPALIPNRNAEAAPVSPLYRIVNRKSNQCDAHTQKRHNTCTGPGKEELAEDHKQAAENRQCRNDRIKRHPVFPLPFGMNMVQAYHTGKCQRIKDSAGENTQIRQQVKFSTE